MIYEFSIEFVNSDVHLSEDRKKLLLPRKPSNIPRFLKSIFEFFVAKFMFMTVLSAFNCVFCKIMIVNYVHHKNLLDFFLFYETFAKLEYNM